MFLANLVSAKFVVSTGPPINNIHFQVILSHVLCLLFRGKTWLCKALVHMEIEPLQQYTSGYSEVRVKGLYLPNVQARPPRTWIDSEWWHSAHRQAWSLGS